jgi:hypothetical protein
LTDLRARSLRLSNINDLQLCIIARYVCCMSEFPLSKLIKRKKKPAKTAVSGLCQKELQPEMLGNLASCRRLSITWPETVSVRA